VPLILGIPVPPTFYLFGAEIAMDKNDPDDEERISKLLENGILEYMRLIVIRWYTAFRNEGRKYCLTKDCIDDLYAWLKHTCINIPGETMMLPPKRRSSTDGSLSTSCLTDPSRRSRILHI